MNTGLLRRIRAIRQRDLHWYDWGHRVMTLVAREDAGSFDGVPRPRDMWFRKEHGRLITTYDYAEVTAQNDGEWRIFDSQNDGSEIVIGWWPRPESNGSISRDGIDGRDEQRLFRRWFIWDGWIKAEWFGLRPWLYYKALHAVVHEKIPFACQQVPPRGTGGYSHWHCQLRKGHEGAHRFRNYTWDRGVLQFVGGFE